MISRIVLIANYNQYESKLYFCKRLAEALQRLGVETLLLELDRGKWLTDTYREIRLFDPDFTMSFNSYFSINGVYPWDVMQLPHLSVLLDPAFYSANFVKSNYSILSSVDLEDCSWFQNNRFKRIFFWPHAVERVDKPPLEERPFDVVFLGTFTDFEGIKILCQKELPPGHARVVFDAAERVLSDNKTSLTKALADAWRDSKQDPEGADFPRIFYFLDQYTRGKDRFELVQGIKNAHVHIFGEPSWNNPFESVSWTTYLGSRKNITIHPPVSYAESLEVMKKSKICLNSNPFFKYGSHERIFNALAFGCLPITMDNLFVRKAFEIGKELDIYLPGKWEEVNEKVQNYLSNEWLRSEIAEAGRVKVYKHHTWDNRAQELLDAMPPILNTILPA